MKGAGTPLSVITQWAFLILVALLLIWTITTWMAASEASIKGLEKDQFLFTLISSINALSLEERGSIDIELTHSYDIRIAMRGENHYLRFRQDGETDFGEYLIMGNANTDGRLDKVSRVCMEKGYEEPGDRVVIRKC